MKKSKDKNHFRKKIFCQTIIAQKANMDYPQMLSIVALV